MWGTAPVRVETSPSVIELAASASESGPYRRIPVESGADGYHRAGDAPATGIACWRITQTDLQKRAFQVAWLDAWQSGLPRDPLCERHRLGGSMLARRRCGPRGCQHVAGITTLAALVRPSPSSRPDHHPQPVEPGRTARHVSGSAICSIVDS